MPMTSLAWPLQLQVCTSWAARGPGRAGLGLVFATEKTGRAGPDRTLNELYW
jgi:hypothetical protein